MYYKIIKTFIGNWATSNKEEKLRSFMGLLKQVTKFKSGLWSLTTKTFGRISEKFLTKTPILIYIDPHRTALENVIIRLWL